jgi:hypothetical protein
MKSRSSAWPLVFIGLFFCGLPIAIMESAPEAAGPVPEMQAGQTYEVWWSCDQTGCAVELATIVHVDKKRGYVLDSRGFWFKPDNAMAFRDARNVPAAAPKPADHLPQIRAER